MQNYVSRPQMSKEEEETSQCQLGTTGHAYSESRSPGEATIRIGKLCGKTQPGDMMYLWVFTFVNWVHVCVAKTTGADNVYIVVSPEFESQFCSGVIHRPNKSLDCQFHVCYHDTETSATPRTLTTRQVHSDDSMVLGSGLNRRFCDSDL
ncbi:hypothetical protein BaRGS_00016053 [Batillaria attramentaria]|uniref:Uncharacterized protein n=1 Tax=Batillaria attramentaria TaxID=370345 RepID=A0ABD0L0D9_9CAEN